ncbi:MFS transporter [Longimicrobium sp.]|uniref:MFS transporter n=1 Tax=Longimicrobium sp. TaxID=2029185 RepID=UPI002CE7ED81|nr:MFS transporter [Longimicrobium sp.]HSU16593.1 MFS transporter [Longimicrobium sp.]
MTTPAGTAAVSPAPVHPAGAAGLRTFLAVWLGQTVSATGSGLTSFALGVWVYQRTGSITLFAGILVFTTIPVILLLPVAGSVVDRYDRRWLMIGADTAGVLSTIAVALLAGAGRLELWHVYAAVAWSAACASVQRAAWSSSVALLVSREQLGRTAGLTQLGQGAAMLIAPLLGGVLLLSVGLRGVILLDAATYLVGATATALVRIPRPPAPTRGPGGGLLRLTAEGWRFTRSRPGLLEVTLFLAVVNLSTSFLQAVLTPMVLSFTTADRLGVAVAAGAVGMLAGGLLMGVSGGPARRSLGVVAGGALMGMALLAVGARASVGGVAAALAVCYFAATLNGACSTALLQASVPPEMQGRVFTALRMIAFTASPIAYATAGPLVDHAFAPVAARMRGGFAGMWTHPGGGPALLLAAAGVLMLAASAALHLSASVRTLDDAAALR